MQRNGWDLLAEAAPACRACGAPGITGFLDLGCTPLADRLVAYDQLHATEPCFPLRVGCCQRCSLVQLLETVPPRQLFCEDYPYYSSVSDAWLAHSRRNVEGLIRDRGLDANSRVVEIASNDGYLLQYYRDAGISVLGIDPAEGPARRAVALGIPTRICFFDAELGRELAASGVSADVVHANNVLAHVPDPNDFLEGVSRILKSDGCAVFEHPYLRDLMEHTQFDTIYHEHVCYFSVTSLDRLLRPHGLYLQDVTRLETHGGSIRSLVGRQDTPSSRVTSMLSEEQQLGMNDPAYYRDFAGRVHLLCDELRALLRDLRAGGYRIAAYGAAAKGSTLLQVAGIGTDSLDFVVDRNVHKHGKYMPGNHIPILPVGELEARMPDYTLLLSWNLGGEILEQQREYRRKGGRFVIPVPRPCVLQENSV